MVLIYLPRDSNSPTQVYINMCSFNHDIITHPTTLGTLYSSLIGHRVTTATPYTAPCYAYVYVRFYACYDMYC